MSADQSRRMVWGDAAINDVDRMVEELKAALHRNGVQLPSLSSDVVPTRGEYLVELGRIPHSTAAALVAVLNQAASVAPAVVDSDLTEHQA